MIQKIGIVGGGHMGSDLLGLLSKDYAVTLWVRRADAAASLDEEHMGPLRRRAERADKRGDAARAALARLKITTDLTELADVDLITESIVEDPAIKRAMLTELSGIVRPDCIVTTNSSFTIPSELAPSCARPERFLGWHFFFPARFVPFVEIIPHAGTLPAAISDVMDLTRALGKRPLLVGKEVVGFLVNRVIGPFYTEGLHMLGEGYYKASEIDACVRGKLTTRGPVESADQIGTDVMYIGELRFPHEKRKGDFMPRLLPWLNDQGRLGVKSGAGCYLYPDGKPVDAADLPRLFGPEGDPGPYDEQTVRDRLWLGVVLEAYKMRDQGVGTADDIEWCIQEILGFEEGPFAWVDRIGVDAARALMVDLDRRFGSRFAPRGAFL